jgi:hypothetical protein
MFLQNYLKGRPLIWLDHATGQWRPATEKEVPPNVPLVDLQIDKGDYLEEEERITFFKYWTDDDQQFFFRSVDGTLIEIDGKNYAEVTPAKDLAGRERNGFSVFSIYSETGQLLFTYTYDSHKYLLLYELDFSFPAPELIDWDYFLCAKASFDYMRRERTERLAEASQSVMLRAMPGETVPQEGWWWTPALTGPASRQYLKSGQKLPEPTQSDYGNIIWYLDKPG